MDARVSAAAAGVLVAACVMGALAGATYGPLWGLIYSGAFLVSAFVVTAVVAGIADAIRRRRQP